MLGPSQLGLAGSVYPKQEQRVGAVQDPGCMSRGWQYVTSRVLLQLCMNMLFDAVFTPFDKVVAHQMSMEPECCCQCSKPDFSAANLNLLKLIDACEWSKIV